MFDKIEKGLRGAYDATKGWMGRHPALTGAAAAGAVAVTGGLALPVAIAVTAGGAAIGAHVGRDDDQKSTAVEEKKDA